MERAKIQCKKIEVILSCSLSPRTELPGLMMNFYFFSNLKDVYKDSRVLDLLAKYLKLDTFEANQTVYAVNSYADKIFFILQGQLAVYKSVKISKTKNSNSETAGELFARARRVTKRNILLEMWTLISDFSIVSVFESFGEEILNEFTLRQNTVIAKDNCVVAYLNNSDYLKVLKTIKKQQVNETKGFLKGLSLFSNWSKHSLEKILGLFRVQEYFKNQALYRQGEVPDGVFIVKKGEVLITQNVRIPKQSQQFDIKESNSGQILRLSKMRQKSPEKSVQVAIKGQTEILGLEEIINNINFRKFSCVCFTDSVQVLQISKEHFTSRILNTDSIISLKRTIDSTSEWVYSRIEAIKKLDLIKDRLEALEKTEQKTERKINKKIKKTNKSIQYTGSPEDDTKKHSFLGKTGTSFRYSSLMKPKEKTNLKKIQLKYIYKPKKNPPANFLLSFRDKINKRKASIDHSPEIFYTLPY